jgi:F0F1-type ATP synthase assembly protein I
MRRINWANIAMIATGAVGASVITDGVFGHPWGLIVGSLFAIAASMAFPLRSSRD